MLRSGFLLIALLILGSIGTTAAFADGDSNADGDAGNGDAGDGDAGDGDAGDGGRADEDRIARLTKAQDRMRVMLAKGEKLEAAGKPEAALECYEAALATYDDLMLDLGRDPRSMRGVAARRLGASSKSDAAVERALGWLAEHQDENGRWDAKGFNKHDPAGDQCDGPGKEVYDVGVTGLALLAFLESGYTDRGSRRDNPYAKTVRQALRFLIERQDAEGCVGSRTSQHFIYNHAIAAAALAEAYGLTKNPRYREPAKKAIGFVLQARNPYMAWRYGVRPGENDSSVSGWCVYALAQARASGLRVDEKSIQAAMLGAMVWADKTTDPKTGRTGYNMMGGLPARPQGMQDRFPPSKSEAMTASAVAMRLHAGQAKNSDVIRKGVVLLAARPPMWNPTDGSIDLYYWFWGTRACLAVGGKEWKSWNKALKQAVLGNQHGEGAGARAGSWDPAGPWGPDGGRVYSTALLALTLRSYYRPLR